MVVYETTDYTVVLNPPEERIEYNYCVVNKENGCVEAELKALPNAIEATLIFQSKLDSYLEKEKAKKEVGEVVSLVSKESDEGLH